MSSNKYDKPLRIELQASIKYSRLILYSHLLSVLFLLYLISLKWWTVLLFLPLLYSYKTAQKKYQHYCRYVTLRLYSDGRFIGYQEDGSYRAGIKIEQVVFLSQLLILTLMAEKKREYLLLFTDAMTNVDWHRLQVFLRFAVQPTDEP